MPACLPSLTRVRCAWQVSFWPLLARNKRSVALDLKHADSRPAVEALLAETDVLIENFAAGTMSRLGLGYEQLRERHPRLIYVECKGFSRLGPYAERSALDEVVQMMSGLATMTGPEGRPLRAGASVVDIVAGLYASIGTLAALHERARTGTGQLVGASLFESAAFLVGQHVVQHGITGEPLRPMPAGDRAWGVYDIFRSAEGKPVFVGVVSDAQWRDFVHVFGLSDLGTNAALSTNNQRMASREWLVPTIAEACAKLSTAELLAKCEEAGLAFGPVNSPEDLLSDPHLNAGGAMREVLVGGRGVKTPRLPLDLGGRQFSVRSQPPRLGEHTRASLLEAGLSSSAVEELVATGLVVAAQ